MKNAELALLWSMSGAGQVVGVVIRRRMSPNLSVISVIDMILTTCKTP
jgi:hypothetical protein